MSRVMLYGNTLVVDALGASLASCPGMELLRVDAPLAELAARLDDLHPDALLFDVSAAQSDLVVRLLRERPELLLIGVDPASDQVLLLSGRRARPVSLAELAGLVVGTDETKKE